MKIFSSRQFEKSYTKLRAAEQEKFKERIKIFIADPFAPILRNHALVGKYQGCRSIAVGGDLRMVYRVMQNDTIVLLDIGTHAKLYKS
jgi:addiction module RelE/StbE family toxin